MTEEFLKDYRVSAELEGKWSDHPNDKGGQTNYGITQTTYTAFRISKGLPNQSVRLVTHDETLEIFWKWYWIAGRCNVLEWPVSLIHFDACVHHGPKAAIELLQAALNVEIDGKLGPKTLAEIRRLGNYDTCYRQTEARRGYLLALTNVDPSQEVFLKGWINRVNLIIKAILRERE